MSYFVRKSGSPPFSSYSLLSSSKRIIYSPLISSFCYTYFKDWTGDVYEVSMKSNVTPLSSSIALVSDLFIPSILSCSVFYSFSWFVLSVSFWRVFYSLSATSSLFCVSEVYSLVSSLTKSFYSEFVCSTSSSSFSSLSSSFDFSEFLSIISSLLFGWFVESSRSFWLVVSLDGSYYEASFYSDSWPFGVWFSDGD